MNVTLISLVFPYPRRGLWPGIERHVGELSRALTKQGIRVRVLTSFWNGGRERESWEGIEIRRVPAARQRWGKAASFLNWDVRSFSRSIFREAELLRDSDVIHTFQGLSSGERLERLGVPVFASFPHREKPVRLQDTVVQLGRFSTERSFFRKVKAVFAGSIEARRVLIDDYGLDSSRVHVVPLGVDGEAFRPPATPRPADPLRERAEGIRLLYVGPLIRRKGVHNAIEAMPSILESSVPCRLTLVGRGPEEERLRALAGRLGVHDRVIFAGYVEEPDLVRHYQDSDIFVFPSNREGFGLVLVEAMACGLPVVATDVPPMPEVLGEGGLVFPPDDPAAIGRAIVRLARDAPLRARLADEGRRQVDDRYLWSRVASQTLEHYSAAVGEGGAPS